MRGFMSLVLGEQSGELYISIHIGQIIASKKRLFLASDDTKAMQMQMGMGAGPNMAFDAPKAYKQERVNLRLLNHEFALEHAEKKILGDKIPIKLVPTSTPTVTTTASTSTTDTTTTTGKASKLNKSQRNKR
jgi:hypothetical protein